MNIQTSHISVGTSPTKLSDASVAVSIQNASSSVVYIGASDVTTTSGYQLTPGDVFSLDASATLNAGDPLPPIYGVVSSGTASVQVLVIKP